MLCRDAIVTTAGALQLLLSIGNAGARSWGGGGRGVASCSASAPRRWTKYQGRRWAAQRSHATAS